VVAIALPASMVGRFLPPDVAADDFSGSVWHGSAGSVRLRGRNVGALEWHVNPWSLFSLTLEASLHWVKVGFVADGTAEIPLHDVPLRDVQGSGPLEDLRDLGIAQDWHGAADFKFSELRASFAGGAAVGGATLRRAVGDLNAAGLNSPAVADGADLGGYTLHFAATSITPGADITAQLSDTGGPLEVRATLDFSADGHTGTLTGSVRPRADAPPALRSQLDELAQLHAPDAQGRIPVDLEFTL